MRFVSFFLFIFVASRTLYQKSYNRPVDFIERLCSKNNPDINDYLLLQDSITGSFKDINYCDSATTAWEPMYHLERLRHFSEAYICPQSKYYKSVVLYKGIVRGIDFWLKTEPKSKNWWYNMIKSPADVGQILINMRLGDKKLLSNMEKNCIEMMRTSAKDPFQYVGANLTDIATHWIYRACLLDDEDLFKYALNLITKSIRYSRSEGIMIDNSYCQHDRQIYVGAYGNSFLWESTKWAHLMKDTKYVFPRNKIDVLSNFARTTYFPSIRGNHFSYNVCGRSISRKGGIKTGVTPKIIAQRLYQLDTIHKEDYLPIIGNQTTKWAYNPQSTLHTHYYYTDYTLHSCPRYTFDIRMASKRTPKCESLNDENVKNYFLSCGGTCLMVNGDEYENIFPVWDWARIPGTTAPHISNIPVLKDFSTYGETDFAGGVSDSIYGASAFVYEDRKMNVQAKKSWFFFDNEIVCLGSDICSSSNTPIETTINQCLDNTVSYVHYSSKTSEICRCFDSHLKRPKWVVHGKVGYYFPDNQNVIVSKGERKGSWHDINKRYKDVTEEMSVFHIGIDHGTKPNKARYSYVLFPGVISSDEMNMIVGGMTVKILNCDEKKHVVYDSHSDILQAILFESGTMKYEHLWLEADQPCAIMIKGIHSQNPMSLHVSNISQIDEDVTISLKYKQLKKKYIVKTKDKIRAGETQKFFLW